MLFDTHCHVHFNAFSADTDEVIEKTRAAGILMNVVGTHKDTSAKAVACAERHEGVWASVGLHPVHLFSQHLDEEESSFQTREEHFDEAYYEGLARHEKVVAIGECGYDTYRVPEGLTKEVVLTRQRAVFAGHVRVARRVSKPLVIHVRDAYEEMIETLRYEQTSGQARLRGVIHCYISNWKNAEQFLALGMYVGFTGIITFPPKKTDPAAQEALLEVVKKAPLDRILLETDAPYLAPGKYRGKRSEPWMVEETARKIAELKGLSYDEVARATTENAKKLFSL
jgi:TatD DNase family protein